MLLIARKPSESIVVRYGDDTLIIKLDSVTRGRVRLLFDGPKTFEVHREEKIESKEAA